MTRPWLGKALEAYKRRRSLEKRSATARLWDFGLTEFRACFLQAAAAAGINFLKPVLYMGRHTGASLDRLENTYTLDEVQKRGRWRSTSSVRRYEKHALVQEVVQRMSASKIEFCRQCEARLVGDLARLWKDTR